MQRRPSPAQYAANRVNAQKSTGPRTAEGKAIVSQNAFKHGFAAKSLYVPEALQPLFEEVTEDLFLALAPEGILELDLFHLLRNHRFNIERIQILQSGLADFSNQTGEDPFVDKYVKADWDRLERYLVKAQAGYLKNLRELRRLQTARMNREIAQCSMPTHVHLPVLTSPRPPRRKASQKQTLTPLGNSKPISAPSHGATQ